ncbi:MAG: DUF4252 domain-containing protein [Alistipes sp.]|nr:DUF4252 domain-containing protein [Alistipes sp.]
MKRLIGIILLALISCAPIHISHAQTVDAMIKRFKKCENAEYHRISGMMLGMIRMIIPNDLSVLQQLSDEELQKILDETKMNKEEFLEMTRFIFSFLEHTKSLTMLSLENCSEEDCQRFIEATTNWTPEGYTINDEQEGVYAKMKGLNISEMAIVNREPKDCSIMTLKGDLTPEFIINAEQSMEHIFSKMAE